MARERCTLPNRLLVRTASNSYFPETIRAISLPDEDAELKAVVERLWSDLEEVRTADDLQNLRRLVRIVRAELDGFAESDILRSIERRRSGGAPNAEVGVKAAEFEVLASGRRTIGKDGPESLFFAESLERSAWDPDSDPFLANVERVVAIPRLREVVVLVGFTRLDPPAVDGSGKLDLQTERAALDIGVSWLPAVKNRGEGLFVQFKPEAIAEWMERPAVNQRQQESYAGSLQWKADRPRSTRGFPGVRYVLMHSLSHLLLTTIALECGYPASSLRKRVYAFDGQYGILLFTATSGSDGTLGGLAGSGGRIGTMLQRAVEQALLCSNDPICAQHSPNHRGDERPLHGATCHGCLLIAETSCEQRNDFLDRALAAETVATAGTAFTSIP